MRSLFDTSGWGRERMGFTDDAEVFDVAAAAIDRTVPTGLSPRAVTAVFFATDAGTAGNDLVYIQHIQFFEAALAEEALLDLVVQQLIAVGSLKAVEDPAARKVRALSAAMKVPAPPVARWSGAVVVLHLANALNVLRVDVGVVRDPIACRLSVGELVANARVVVQDMRSTELRRGLG
ncbi:hypothetical protein [Mycobacteroides abscessus]|uniref:hypothetical protein n=1 Tax=Mycobacteroides abscessus TaxID=36809 RepID=UPI000D87BA41|nr:hypothetical protein [Mycobacteroides abscessus]SPX87956.1 Uncharacterised protein [Mycobacteroides abscessus]